MHRSILKNIHSFTLWFVLQDVVSIKIPLNASTGREVASETHAELPVRAPRPGRAKKSSGLIFDGQYVGFPYWPSYQLSTMSTSALIWARSAAVCRNQGYGSIVRVGSLRATRALSLHRLIREPRLAAYNSSKHIQLHRTQKRWQSGVAAAAV
jgi:hypothetical protein